MKFTFIYLSTFLYLLFTNFANAVAVPSLGTDGVLSFHSEGGVSDQVTITTNGSNYDVVVTSDGNIQPTISFAITNVDQFRFLNLEMGSDSFSAPSELYTEMSHYDEYDAKVSEMADMFDLVRYGDVTIKSIQSGPWHLGTTWESGFVPVEGDRILIESGHVITVDQEISDSFQTIRLDGTLKFSTTQNSSLKVDTMVGTMGSRFEMGTEANPIPEGITAKLIIENQGDFVNTNEDDPDYDPSHLGLGLILHGATEIYGMKRTGYATFKKALAGANSVTLDKLPNDWKIGDKIVIAGSARSAIEDEARIITGIGGRSISFANPLVFNHTTPTHTKEGLELKMHVINLTRNAIITTQEGVYRTEMDGTEPKSRGHVMFMHTNDVNINYAGFYELGRTNKLGTMTNMERDENGDISVIAHNPIARYPCHFHRTGADGTSFGVIQGSAIDGSPGWGYVNHRGAAYIENNVAYDVDGAAFISEVGNEIGTFINNVSIRTLGRGDIENFSGEFGFILNIEKTKRSINEFGSAGDGFWIHSHTVVVKDNVASGFSGGAFQFWNQSIDGVERRSPEDVAADRGTQTRADYLEGNGIYMENNLGYGGNILYSPNFTIEPDPNAPAGIGHINKDMVGWGINTGIRRKYNGATVHENLVLIGDLENPIGEAAFDTHSNGKNVIFYKPHVEGFIKGFKMEHNGRQQGIYGGYFNNIYNIYVAKRHTRAEYTYFVDNTFGTLSQTALNNVKAKLPEFKGVQLHYVGIEDTGAFDLLEEEVAARTSDGEVSNHLIKHNGALYKAYLQNEQHPDSIPPNNTANFGTQTNRDRFESGNLVEVFGKEMYDPSSVFVPSLPDINYTNTVFADVSTAYLEGFEFRDVPIGRIFDFTIPVGQTLDLASTEYFDRLYDDNAPIYLTPTNSEPSKATATLDENASVCTVTAIAEGTTELILETTGEAKVVINISVVETPELPVVGEDTVFVEYETTRRFDILANDTGINKENGFSINITTAPNNGNIVINNDNSITYTPADGASGSDSFSYTVEDFIGTVSAPGNVNITISEEAPDYTVTVLKGESMDIDITRAITATGSANNGNVSSNGTILTYTHDNSSNLSDSFTYNVGTATGTITITADENTTIEDTTPLAHAGNNMYVNDNDSDGSETVILDGSLSTDLVGNIVAYSWEIPGVAGSPFSGVNPTVTLPVGTHTATLTVTDNSAFTSTANVTIEVDIRENIFLNAETSSDTEANTARNSDAVVDGDTSVGWQSQTQEEGATIPQSMYISLEEPYLMEQIQYTFGTFERIRSSEWKFYTSTDGVNYTEVEHVTTDVGTNYTTTFNTPVLAQYFKFEFLAYSEFRNDVRLFEIVGHGTKVPNILPIANAGIDKTWFDEDQTGSEDGFANVLLDGSSSVDEDDNELAFHWTSNQGGYEFFEQNPIVSLPIGIHEFTLTVTDLDGATDTDTVTIEVVAGAENIALYKPVDGDSVDPASDFAYINDNDTETIYSNTENLTQAVAIDLELLYDLERIVLNWENNNYAVDYNIESSNDGVNWNLESSQTANNELQNSVTLTGVTTRYIRILVSDSFTGNSFGITELEVYKQNIPNLIPIANAGPDATISDIGANGLETVTLNGNGSSDTDGSIVNYIWNIMGYAPLEGINPTVNLPVGETTITLTVTDNQGATNTDTTTITVVDDANNFSNLYLFDFENGSSGDITTLAGNAVSFSVVDNPESSSINTSSKTLKIDIDSEERASPIAGIKLPFTPEITPRLRYLHVKIYATYSGVNNTVQVRGSTIDNITTDNITNAAVNTWEDLVFDLESTTYTASDIRLWLNRTAEPWTDQTIYIDDIYLSNDATPFTGNPNVAPTATTNNYTATDTDGNGYEMITLDATASTDPDNSILSYRWEIPNVGNFVSSNPTKNLNIPVGTYNATLGVTDVDNEEGTTNFTITVNPNPSNVLPVANAGSDQTIQTQQPISVTLDATGSNDPDGNVVGYRWDIPNIGTFNGVLADVVFPVGTTVATLTVTDNDGAVDTDTVTISLESESTGEGDNEAPTANAGEDQTGSSSLRDGVENDGLVNVTLDGSASSDTDGAIVSYSWDIPGVAGSPFSGVNPTVAMPIGNHTVTLTVTDNDGATHTDTVDVIILETNIVDLVEDFDSYHTATFNDAVSERIANPVPGGINTSSEVIEVTLPAENRRLTAGINYSTAKLPEIITNKEYLRALVYKNEVSDTRLRIKIDGTNTNINPVTDIEQAGVWTELLFDLGVSGTKTISSIIFQLDRNGGSTEEIVYIDDITLVNLDDLSVLSYENDYRIYNKSGSLFITNLPEDIEISIYDYLGRKHINEKLSPAGIDISNLKQGIYFVQFIINNKSISLSFLKE